MEESPLPCDGKMAFDSKKAADSAALTLAYQHGTLLHSYRCQYCQLWHLTSNAT